MKEKIAKLLANQKASKIILILGVIGIVLICLAYPMYTRTLKKEREKIAPEIIRLTDELMK